MHIDKQRYSFAMSAFVRLYGRNVLMDDRIKRFCQEWSEKDSHAPLEGLNEVDKYFRLEYNNWSV